MVFITICKKDVIFTLKKCEYEFIKGNKYEFLCIDDPDDYEYIGETIYIFNSCTNMDYYKEIVLNVKMFNENFYTKQQMERKEKIMKINGLHI